MEQAIDTGFKDKFGCSIFVGDVVQHRLGKFGKSGGTRNLRVIKFGKGYDLISESRFDDKYGGVSLTQKVCEFLVVLKSDQLPR